MILGLGYGVGWVRGYRCSAEAGGRGDIGAGLWGGVGLGDIGAEG